MTETLTLAAFADDQIAPLPSALFQFLVVNGFVYRANTQSGEMWRLVIDKQSQVWKKIDDVTGAVQ